MHLNKKQISLILIFTFIFTYIQLPFSDNAVYGSTIINFTGTTADELQVAINNAANGATIVLNKNVNINKVIVIPDNKTITITDNGAVIRLKRDPSYSGDSPGQFYYKPFFFYIPVTATLNLKGSNIDSLVLDGNNVKLNSNSGYDLGFIDVKGTFNMYDGVLLEKCNYLLRKRANVMAILVGGTFNMYGGVIRDNKTSQGAVAMFGSEWNEGVFNLYGGVILNNSNDHRDGSSSGEKDLRKGGGVYCGLYWASTNNTYGSTFNMYGGKIINNKAELTGREGYYGLFVHNRSTFNRMGGIINDYYKLMTNVTLSGPSTVEIKQSITLSSSVAPENVEDKSLIWFSSNNNIATVDKYGKVTGVSGGTVTITGAANDGSGVYATKTITVSEKKITKITITGEGIVEKADTIILKASIVPSDATDKSLVWSSGDNSIATVDGVGLSVIVRGIKKGTVTITAAAQDGSGVKASKTITVTSDSIQGEAKYITVDDIINYETGYADPENDPKYKGEYKYIHDPNSLNGVLLDNSMGYVDFRNRWQDIAYNIFPKVGTYTIQYRVQDNPPTAASNSNFQNYRYYSDAVESTIYAHRKPIALYTINGSMATDSSYDLDHSVSRADKGIAKWEWRYINSNDVINKYTATSKADGVNKVNSWLNTYRGVEYKIILRVQDIEGAWSEPCIKKAGEISRPVADFIIDKNPMVYKTDTQKITDMSYDTNGLTLSYNWTVTKGGQTILSSTVKDISSALNQTINNLYPNVIGTYNVSLKVTNSAGVQSDTVTKSFEVIVNNYAPTIDFNLVTNESPAWTFPKVIGLHNLKFRPTNGFFYEEKTKFNVNMTDSNPDNLGFTYNWKLERFAVKDTNNISGAAANTYSYTTQHPFTNSFKSQGLSWGAYRIILSVTDRPPVPPYQSTDVKTVTVAKNYYIVPELSVTGSYESTNTEIMVGDTIKLKAKTDKMTESVCNTINGTKFVLSKTSEDSNFAYWEKNIVIPESITESGTYYLNFTGSTTYGGNGSVTREVRDSVQINITALKLINFRITDIVNHPDVIFPYTKDMLINQLISYKAGYYVTFKIDSKGKPDSVYGKIDISNNGSIDQVINLTKVASGDTEIWQGRFYTTPYLSTNTVISIKMDCSKGSTTYNYNEKENWDGRSLISNGSALQDGRVNLTN